MLADLPPHVELPELGMVSGWVPGRDLDQLLRASELENHANVDKALEGISSDSKLMKTSRIVMAVPKGNT
jgi:hypothetical protein